MDDRSRPHRSHRERSPIRRLSSIGGVTTGWRSTLETTPGRSIGSFVIETLIAAAVFLGLVALLVVLS